MNSTSGRKLGSNSGSNSGRKVGNNVHVTNASINELPTPFTNYLNKRAQIIPENAAIENAITRENNAQRRINMIAKQNAANKTAKQNLRLKAKNIEQNAQRRTNNQSKPKGIFGTLHNFFRSGHLKRQTRKNKAILKTRNNERQYNEKINTEFILHANKTKHAEFKENPRKYIKDNYHYLNILLNNIKEYYTERWPLPLYFIIITGHTDYGYDELHIPNKAQLWIPKNFNETLILKSIEYCEECETFLKRNLRIVK